MNTLKPHAPLARRNRPGAPRRRTLHLAVLALALIGLASWIPPKLSDAAPASARSGSDPVSPASGRNNPTSPLSFNQWGSNGPDGIGAVNSLAVDPGNPSVVYAGAASGLYKSTDDGRSWSRLENGLNSPSISALAIDPLNSATVYAGTFGDGTFKSTDGGASWSAVHVDLPSTFGFTFIAALAIAPGNPGIIYALGSSEFFRSTDGGVHWSSVLLGASGMAVAPGSPNTIYAFNFGCDPAIGCFGFIDRSTDGGVSWNVVNSDGFNFSSSAVNPRDPNTLYGGGSGVFKSTDGGVSWSSFSNGLPANLSDDFVRALAIDPSDPNIVYAGTAGAGVFRSTDGGAHWGPFNEGLTDLRVNALAIDRSGRNLHAGTGRGVFDYRDTTDCAYSISPAGQSFPSAGATGSVAVTAAGGCGWEASSAAGWIAITSGASGVGSGVVVFSVTADGETGPRTGMLSIAGQTFTVTQSGTQPPNPVDDTTFFVRQHYLDFFSREPDAEGLAFWVDNIESCGADLQCREVKRINTSAAFFLSIEFQETGYLVYRFYKAAFGDASLPDGTSGGPAVRFQEFLPDTQRVGRGVVVNQGEWRAQLESNKRDLADEFASRPRFTAAYPETLTAAQYVDALNRNAGGVLSQAERDRLVADLSANVKTRAQVLWAVAEDDDLARGEYERAFVLTQYFGYLRRDPDAAPDSDLSGYRFWLQKLNQFGGDFRRAEMVRAFLSSSEYRGRFGP
jgi:photosystem II stability/assembly factor-like uncharacterized protein